MATDSTSCSIWLAKPSLEIDYGCFSIMMGSMRYFIGIRCYGPTLARDISWGYREGWPARIHSALAKSKGVINAIIELTLINFNW